MIAFALAGYTACCDWWSVGVILYEMRIGRPPFYASTRDETQMKVRQNFMQLASLNNLDLRCVSRKRTLEGSFPKQMNDRNV